jgi:hypothetical protein
MYSTMMSMHRQSGITGVSNIINSDVSGASVKLKRCRQIQSKMNVPGIEGKLTPLKHPVPTGLHFVEQSMRLPVAKGMKTSPKK